MKTTKPKPQAIPKRIGRPSSYTQQIGERICELLVEGKSLRSICAQDDMPCSATVLKWVSDDALPFADQYARALDARADGQLEQILEIMEDKTLDANDKRVRIDALKWVMGKQKPKKYGERLDQTIEHVNTDVADRLAAGRQRVLEMKQKAG